MFFAKIKSIRASSDLQIKKDGQRHEPRKIPCPVFPRPGTAARRVNSPVRAFKSVGGEPFFVQRADGPYLFDVDGNRYIDYVGSWGPMIVGHNHPQVRDAVQRAIGDGLSFGAPCPAEVTMAETLTRLVPSCEMVRMVNSGTEATLSANRLDRRTGAWHVKVRRLLSRPCDSSW